MIASSLLALLVGWHTSAAAAQLTLTWSADPAADEEGFLIERGSGSTSFGEIAATGPDVTSYVDSGLADSTTYCYRVRAFNDAGTSDYSNTACAATAQMFGLAVLRTGAGTGTVTSTPVGITCGGNCSGTYPSGTSITLTASAAAGSTFSGWTGGCSGAGACSVTLNATTTVSASFAVQAVALTINKTGPGTGSVTSSPAGITCGSTCTGNFPGGSIVTLSASAATGSTFSGWSGSGCAGTGSCIVSLAGTTAVTATYTLQSTSALLTITKAGSGGGTVSSAPGGIDCGPTCSWSYPSGTVTTLTAVAGSGSVFTGWSGIGCSGTGTCAVILTSETAGTEVTAVFAMQSPTLTVARLGNGTVTSTPSGIACGPTCASSFPADATVTLVATPETGSSFAGWTGGGCAGTGACAVILTSPTSVTATFGLAPPTSFSDDFQRADSTVLGMGWTEPQGDFVIQDRRLQNGTENTRHLAVQSTLTMATGQVTASFSSLNNNAGPKLGLVVGFVDAGNYYAAYRQVGGTSVLKIIRVTNGVESVLAQRNCGNPGRGSTFDLAVSVSSSKIILTSGGKTVTASGLSVAPGKVGAMLAGGGASHVVDDFKARP